MNSIIEKNVIMMGINLESQLLAIKKFIEKQEKKKTVILYPDDKKLKHIGKKIKEIGFNNSRIFKYSKDSEVLTGQIDKLTNYKQRKVNLSLYPKPTVAIFIYVPTSLRGLSWQLIFKQVRVI